MLLTPTELERLTIFTAAELARKRRARASSSTIPRPSRSSPTRSSRARATGARVAELIGFGSTIL